MQIVLDIGLIQIVGIMPTLILAQIGLGRATQDVEAKFTMDDTRNYINDKPSFQAPMSTSGDPLSPDNDEHSEWNTVHRLQSKESFTIDSENRHRSHHFQYPNTNHEDSPEDQAHRDKGRELNPASGVGKHDQRSEIVYWPHNLKDEADGNVDGKTPRCCHESDISIGSMFVVSL